jgi:hypothetical protein
MELARASQPVLLDARAVLSPERVDVDNPERTAALRRDLDARGLAPVVISVRVRNNCS